MPEVGQHPSMEKWTKPVSTSESKAGAVAAFTLALCFAAVLIMGTIKIGLIWFT